MTTSIKCVVSAGDSIAWGDELRDRDNRYAKIIADKLGAQLIDLSSPGLSNEMISGRVINAVYEYQPRNTLVIVNWSHVDRLCYYDKHTDKLMTLIRSYSFDRAESAMFPVMHNYGLSEKDIDPFVIEQWYNDHDHPLYLQYKLINTIYYTQLALQNYETIFTCDDHYTYKLILKAEDVVKEPGRTHYRPGINNIISRIDHNLFFKEFVHKLAWDNKHPRGPRRHPLDQTHIEYAALLWKYLNENRGIGVRT